MRQSWDTCCFDVSYRVLLRSSRAVARIHLEYCLADQHFVILLARFDCRDDPGALRYRYCLLRIRSVALYFLHLHSPDFESACCHYFFLTYLLKNPLSPHGCGLILGQSSTTELTFGSDLDPRNNPLWIYRDQGSGIYRHSPLGGPYLTWSWACRQ